MLGWLGFLCRVSLKLEGAVEAGGVLKVRWSTGFGIQEKAAR